MKTMFFGYPHQINDIPYHPKALLDSRELCRVYNSFTKTRQYHFLNSIEIRFINKRDYMTATVVKDYGRRQH